MGLPPEEAIRLLAGYERDGIAVLEEKDREGNLSRLFAYRGPSSGCELYYARAEEGTFALSDSFRDVVEVLPPSQRKVSAEGFLDFLLFQYSVFPETPIDPIRRLGHGELLKADRCGNVSVEILARLDASFSVRDYDEGVGKIEEALCRAIGKPPEGTVNLLSGGVDSTLVQALLGPGYGAAAAVIDTPEFAHETGNARRAASLCGIPLDEQYLEEGNYLYALERETAMAGFPLSLPQTALISSVFDLKTRSFVSGFDADSLFSLPRSKRKLVFKGVKPDSFEEEDFSVSPEKALVEGLFGREKVAERIAERKENVRSRVANPHGLSSLSLGCLTSFFSSSFPAYRQLALARKKTLSTPFMERNLVETALGFPLPDRVFRKGKFKPVLKDLLSRRLSDYPKDQEKGGSGLPRTRFCTEGPLKDFFRENPLPLFIDPEKADPILKPGWESSMTAYRCVAWSVWEKAIKTIPWRENRWP
jgi:asparagine synthetase B (glutamine-hydrolysing)